MLLADGFDECLIGLGRRCGKPDIAVYDEEKCIDLLMKRDGMPHDEATEFFEFNVVGSWVGEETPIFLRQGQTHE